MNSTIRTAALSLRLVALAAPLTLSVLLAPIGLEAGASEPSWRAGVGRAVITPQEQLWMSGYGARDRPAEGKRQELWAKALALEDGEGNRTVLVTLDLIGLDRDFSLEVRERLVEKHGLELGRVALATSHTHTGPVVGRNLEPMYVLTEGQWAQIDRYTARLGETILSIVGEALENLEPAALSWGAGQATFAVNRRENAEGQVGRLREEGRLRGPVDYNVPVLAVRHAEERTLGAVVFGYACHATVLSDHDWSGDYPGFAQAALEQEHPGATALFWAGCGGDVNPLPRRSAELAEEYGRQLAEAVNRVLRGVMPDLEPVLEARYAEVELPLSEVPGRQELEAQLESSDRYTVQRAQLLLERLQGGDPLPESYPYPVQVWRLGDEVRFILLGGEVVVDYALRLKQELGHRKTWVAGYVNDVMAYIPSERVLAEGGYEGEGAMRVYGLPSAWAPGIEEIVVQTVHDLVESR